MLASILLETSMGGGTPNVSPEMLSKYTYDDGAALIAMESAADLHEIFCEGFYDMEELEIRQHISVQEGASEEVLEGIGSTIKEKAKASFGKIKELLKKLWEKVKAFFYNVKRYLSSIFTSTESFLKNYESDLKNLKLNDFTYPVHVYTVDKLQKRSGDANVKTMASLLNEAKASVKVITDRAEFAEKRETYGGDMRPDTKANAIKAYGSEKIDAVMKEVFGTTDESKIKEKLWSDCRNGAKYGDAPDKRRVNIKDIIKGLKDAPAMLKTYNELSSKLDKVFSDAIKEVGQIESRADEKNYANAVAVYKAFTTSLTKLQNLQNASINAQTSAISEMVKTYRKVITAALRYKQK
jgi:hypothetical protein